MAKRKERRPRNRNRLTALLRGRCMPWLKFALALLRLVHVAAMVWHSLF